MSAEASKPAPKLGFWTQVLYGLGALGTASKAQLLGLLLIFYNQLVGLDAPVVSFAIFLALLIDAVWDPIVGQWSDNTRTRLGRRHPFIYVAAVPAAIAFAMLFRPPMEWSESALFFYLLTFVVLGRVFDSLVEIPASALMPELTHNYDQRTSLQSIRYFFGAVTGGALAALLGFGYFLKGHNGNKYGQLEIGGYAPYAVTVAIIGLVAVLISAFATQRFVPYMHKPAPRPSLGAIFRQVGTALSNRNFVALAASALIFGISVGVSGGLQAYFYTYFWELGNSALLTLRLWALPAGVLGVFCAPLISRALGKKRACITLFFMAIFCTTIPLGGRLLGIMPSNDSPLLLPILIADAMATGALAVMGFIIVTSMLADVVEEVQVRTGQRSEGLLFAADSLVRKFTSSFASLVPGLLIAFVHFPKGALPGHVDPDILRHLALIYLPITTGLTLCSTSAILFYRIDKQDHQANLDHLAEAAAMPELMDPLVAP